MIRTSIYALIAIFALSGTLSADDLLDGLPPPPPSSLYDIETESINGTKVPLRGYRNRVLLIVNITTTGPLVKQIGELEKLYSTFEQDGFSILAFPSNDFTWQKRMTARDITDVCYNTYHVTFPIFALTKISGSFKDPVYQFLTNRETNPVFNEDVSWNFVKFLVGRDGTVIGRYASNVSPEDERIKSAIEKALR